MVDISNVKIPRYTTTVSPFAEGGGRVSFRQFGLKGRQKVSMATVFTLGYTTKASRLGTFTFARFVTGQVTVNRSLGISIERLTYRVPTD